MSSEPLPVSRRRVRIVNAQGIHARPATMIVTLARRFSAEVMIVLVSAPDGASSDPGTRVDAKQMLEVMFLGAPGGSTLDVEASGSDAEAAAEAVAGLIGGGFGEP